VRIKIELGISGVAAGELYQFVDTARAGGVEPERQVEVVTDHHDPSIIEGLELEVDLAGGAGSRPILLTPAQIADVVSVLDVIEREEGDARGVMVDLMALRQVLKESR